MGDISKTEFTNKAVIGIVERSCSHVDSRLMHHGLVVAHITQGLLETANIDIDDKLKRDICMCALIHDIGAYKTEEINEMATFEADNVWPHSIYGSLFLKHFSPLPHLSDIILFHHTDNRVLEQLPIGDKSHRFFAQIINIADRADVFFMGEKNKEKFIRIAKARNGFFSDEVIELFEKLPDKYLCFDKIPVTNPDKYEQGAIKGEKFVWEDDFYDEINKLPLTAEEMHEYLEMLVYAIDFRSRQTVTHTIATVSIAVQLGKLMGFGEETVRMLEQGALLHDIGKVGIPPEILEKPGKLTYEEMEIMKTHITVTEDILGDLLCDEVKNIAIRHHEKLDGSGYKQGLKGSDLSEPEKVMAVADIAGALLGTRSYKDAFSKEKTLHIIRDMVDSGLIDPVSGNLFIDKFDYIRNMMISHCDPLIEIYECVNHEYEELEEMAKSATALLNQ